MKSIKCSIVMGAINEANIVHESLEELYQYLSANDMLSATEVVVVTSESSDNTAAIISQNIQKFYYKQQLSPGKRVGKGRDIKLGVLKARGEYILYMDIDLATPLVHVSEIIDQLKDGNDAVIGVRDIATMHNSISRKVGSRLTNLLVKLMIWQNIPDTQCGFKAFRSEVVKDVFNRQTIMGWGFDFEILAILKRRGYKIAQYKVSGWSDPKDVGLVGDSQAAAMISTLKELIKVRLNIIQGVYKR